MSGQDLTIWVVLPLMMTSLVLGLIPVIRGPSLADRVLGLDFISTVTIALLVAQGAATDSAALIDVAMLLALTALLGTIGFAYYIHRSVD